MEPPQESEDQGNLDTLPHRDQDSMPNLQQIVESDQHRLATNQSPTSKQDRLDVGF